MNVKKDIQKAVERDTRWDTGKLGEDEAHVQRVSPEDQAELDEAAELKLISIRLQKGLIKALKVIAEVHGVGYQPLIRDLLQRFARAELRNIALKLTDEKLSLEELVSPAAKYLSSEEDEEDRPAAA